jgi:hypothetical protein
MFCSTRLGMVADERPAGKDNTELLGLGSAAGLVLEAPTVTTGGFGLAGVAVDFCCDMSGLSAGGCVSPIGLGAGRRGCGFHRAHRDAARRRRPAAAQDKDRVGSRQ